MPLRIPSISQYVIIGIPKDMKWKGGDKILNHTFPIYNDEA
jgi:hypothetical protein